MSRYAGLAHHWSVTPIPEGEMGRKIQEESDVLRQKIRIQLNPYDPADLKLIALVEEIPKYTDATQFQGMKIAIENLVAEIRNASKTSGTALKKKRTESFSGELDASSQVIMMVCTSGHFTTALT